MPRQKKKPAKPYRHALANFIDQVISAATVGPDFTNKHSAVRCWKKPDHRRCTGRIIVGITATDEIIFLPQDFDFLVKYLTQNPEYDDTVYTAVWDGENVLLRSTVSEITGLSQLLSELFRVELNPQKRLTIRRIIQKLENIDNHWSAN
ncbi:MAG: hypothetical protein PHU23_17480 [Dehalococcoidales bacterium]|nr:hypothetical protein [Dehalococcoidales bacterium]